MSSLLTPPRPAVWPLWLGVAALHATGALWYVTDVSPGTAAAKTGLPLDDAWIHLVYGRSLVEHGGPYYNPGQLEAGFTSPLWAMLLAVVYGAAQLTGVATATAVKALGVSVGTTATAGAALLAWRVTGRRLPAAFAALLVGASPQMQFAQISGMEVSLAASTGLWTIFALHRGALWWAGIGAAACYWARPELLLLVALVVAGGVAVQTPGRRRAAALRLGLPPAIAAGAWVGFCVAAHGRPLPNTFYAKFSAETQTAELPRIATAAWEAVAANGSWATPALLLAAALGLLQRRPRTATILLLVTPPLWILGLARTRALPAEWADYFCFARYAQPVVPMLLAAAAIGLGALLHVAHRAGAGAPVRGLLAAGVAAATLLPYPTALVDSRADYAWHCQNMNEVQVACGRWVADHVPPGETVVINDAGAIRYFGERTCLDVQGLNCGALLDDIDRLLAVRSTPAAMATFMHANGARHLIIFRSWFPDLVAHDEFERYFEPVAHFTSEHYVVFGEAFGQDEKVVFRLRDPAAPAK